MARKIVRAMSILNIIIAVVLYFAIASLFSNDAHISALLEETGFASTLLRMTLYVIPGIHLISGLFGLVFSAKGILTFIGTIAAVSSACILLFLKSETVFMFYLGIASVSISVIYLLSALLIRRPKPQKESE